MYYVCWLYQRYCCMHSAEWNFCDQLWNRRNWIGYKSVWQKLKQLKQLARSLQRKWTLRAPWFWKDLWSMNGNSVGKIISLGNKVKEGSPYDTRVYSCSLEDGQQPDLGFAGCRQSLCTGVLFEENQFISISTYFVGFVACHCLRQCSMLRIL